MPKFEALILFVIFSCFLVCSVQGQGKNHKTLKCLVCRKIMEEVKNEISKAETKKIKIAVGGYHLDDSGNTNQRVVPYYQSDIFLNEVMESVCEKMKDYVRARRKLDRKLIILPLVLPNGEMNPDFSEVDPILDDDLNKSLGHYCQEISNEYEEEIVAKFKKNPDDNEEEVNFCSSVAEYCVGFEDFEDPEELSPSLNEVINEDKDEF